MPSQTLPAVDSPRAALSLDQLGQAVQVAGAMQQVSSAVDAAKNLVKPEQREAIKAKLQDLRVGCESMGKQMVRDFRELRSIERTKDNQARVDLLGKRLMTGAIAFGSATLALTVAVSSAISMAFTAVTGVVAHDLYTISKNKSLLDRDITPMQDECGEGVFNKIKHTLKKAFHQVREDINIVREGYDQNGSAEEVAKAKSRFRHAAARLGLLAVMVAAGLTITVVGIKAIAGCAVLLGITAIAYRQFKKYQEAESQKQASAENGKSAAQDKEAPNAAESDTIKRMSNKELAKALTHGTILPVTKLVQLYLGVTRKAEKSEI